MRTSRIIESRSFMCLQKFYYDHNMLQYDLNKDPVTEMANIFYRHGFNSINFDHHILRQLSNDLIKEELTSTTSEGWEKSYLKLRIPKIGRAYRLDKSENLKIEVAQAKTIALIFFTFLHFKSIAKTIKLLSSIEIIDFDWAALAVILKNGFYAGLVKVNGQYKKCEAIPAIIPIDVFVKVQDLLNATKLRDESSLRSEPKQYLLNGFVRNHGTLRSYCGYKIQKKSGRLYYYYGCPSTLDLTHHNISAEKFESLFLLYFKKIIPNFSNEVPTDYFTQIHESIYKTMNNFISLASRKRIQLLANFSDSKTSELEVLLKESIELEESLKYFEKRHNFVAFGEQFLSSLNEFWKTGNLELRKCILHTIFPNGVEFDHKTKEFSHTLIIGKANFPI